MEQNKEQAKKYEELNVYERAMANASLEQRMEAMARDLNQIALALRMSVHIDSTFYNEGNAETTVYLIPSRTESSVSRECEFTGDLFGIIEEANKKKEHPEE